MTIKELFEKAEEGTLTYDQFIVLAEKEGAKFTDLSEGNYVSKQKFDDEVNAKVQEIETLNTTISARNDDLAQLQQKLEEAGTDADKLTTLSNDFNTLKTKYDNDVKEYKAQLKKQGYEFAVREFANSKDFTSQAAKRDFISSMIAKDLKMENNTIIGAEDFVTMYSANNADAFVTQAPAEPAEPKPHFVQATQGAQEPSDPTGGFANAFHFTPIHPIPTND